MECGDFLMRTSCCAKSASVAGRWRNSRLGSTHNVLFSACEGACFANHYGFDTETPYEDLSDAHARKVLLYGSGDEHIRVSYTKVLARQHHAAASHPFEGIIPNMEQALSRKLSPAAVQRRTRQISGCAAHARSCAGTRLNRCCAQRIRRQTKPAGRQFHERLCST